MFPTTQTVNCQGSDSNDPMTVCLLPTGSAWEGVPGISHLFENLLTNELRQRGSSHIQGITTEDYVILFCHDISPGKILNTLHDLPMDPLLFEKIKNGLIDKLEYQKANQNTGFFRFVWKNTSYEQYVKNPLGEVDDIRSITLELMEEFKRRISKKELFFYTNDGLERINGIGCGWGERTEPAEVSWEKDREYKNTRFDIGCLTGNIDVFYLLIKIISQWDENKSKRIQYSEKKRAAAFVLESGTSFPPTNVLPRLREKAILDIARQVTAVRVNFVDNAINELESVFFSGQPWYRRVQKLFHVPLSEIQLHIDKLRYSN